jgi:L-fuculose-phosphate aldolase
MPFVAMARPIPSMTEATMGRGDVGCIAYTKAYSRELSEAVHRYFEERRELAARKPIGVIMPMHGVVVSGPSVFMAYSMLERIEGDAFCAIAQKLFER